MTLREISLPKGISSTPAHTTTVDQQKADTSHRRRLEIKRLRSTGRDKDDEYEDRRGPCRSHGAVSVMGRRREMEDAVKVEEGVYDKYDYFAVYDGHGGSHVAEECRDRMHDILREEVETWDAWRENEDLVDWEVVMENCFERMDEEVGKGGEDRVNCKNGNKNKVEETTVGSTAVVAIVGEEEVVVANCGDSRAVICRNGVALPLSLDHKPDRPDELARIEAAGGRVINWNGYRVMGVLATSRSIGDHYLKPYVPSKPEITISKRTEADEFLILASDGLWDVISNEVACKVVRRCLRGRIRPDWILNKISNINSSRAEVAAILLTELAIAKGSKDNISVIVVDLRKFRRFTCS